MPTPILATVPREESPMRRPVIRLWSAAVSTVLLAAALLQGCAPAAPVPTAPETTRAAGITARATALARTLAVQERASDGLLARSDVVGTATALGRDGRPVVRIYTRRA